MIMFKILFSSIYSLTHAEYSFPKEPYFGEGGHDIIIHYL